MEIKTLIFSLADFLNMLPVRHFDPTWQTIHEDLLSPFFSHSTDEELELKKLADTGNLFLVQ
jgi:hypothetical protein